MSGTAPLSVAIFMFDALVMCLTERVRVLSREEDGQDNDDQHCHDSEWIFFEIVFKSFHVVLFLVDDV